MNPNLLTVKQSAEWLGISVGLTYELVAARKIAHERHGFGRGKILIPLAALEEYRRGQTVGVQLAVSLLRPKPVKLKHLRA